MKNKTKKKKEREKRVKKMANRIRNMLKEKEPKNIIKIDGNGNEVTIKNPYYSVDI